MEQRGQTAEPLAAPSALVRLEELETLRALARQANARLDIGVDKRLAGEAG